MEHKLQDIFSEELKRHVRRFVPPRYIVRRRAFNARENGEPELQYLKNLVNPVRSCIDVGAHEGLYTYELLKLSPQVDSYEPNPEKARFLARAFRGCSVTVHPIAASSCDGRSVLSIPADDLYDRTQEATLHRIPSPGYQVEVETRRLDSIGHENVGFIKIDVEGHEEAVLDGARDLIARERPVLLVEIERRHTGRDPRLTFGKIMAWGYAGLFLVDGELVGVEHFVEQKHQDLSNLSRGRKFYKNNFIFLPK